MKITYTLSAVLTLLAISALQVQRGPDAGAALPDGATLGARPDTPGRVTQPGHADGAAGVPCQRPEETPELPSSACSQAAPAQSASPAADGPTVRDDLKPRQRDRAG